MNENRFVIKSTATELELYDDDVQIGEFPHFEWVAKSVDSVVDLLNKQQVHIKDLNFVINIQEKEIDSLKSSLKEKEALTEENEQLRTQLLICQQAKNDGIEQQDFINLLFEELLDAQRQGYVVNFTHKNKPCSIIPKEDLNE